MQIKCFCTVGNHKYLPDTGSRFRDTRADHLQGLPKMFPYSTLFAILFTIVNALASRTQLYADQVWNVYLSCFGVPCILRGFKIVEYIQYSVA